MSEQTPGPETQPRVLTPATAPAPAYVAAPPPRRASGVLTAILVLFAVFGVFAALFVGLIFAIGYTMSDTDTSLLTESFHSGNESASHKIAIVTVDNVIMEMTERNVIRQLKTAQEDEHVKAIVLKVDSPGGTINASDHIHRKVKQVRTDPTNPKPIVVSMQGLAASGGYYISAPANKIFAERTTMTGSIGVIATFPNVSGLMQDFNVGVEVVKTGPRKDSGSMFRPMTNEERERWHAVIGDAFDVFLDVVSDGRSMDKEVVRKLATGDVYTAREALEHKLIDEIGYLEDAIAAAEKIAGVTDSKVIEYKRPLDLVDLLLGSSASARANPTIDLQSILRANVPRVMFLTQANAIEL
jgi:protease-4